jgi:hypothetical protein
MDYHAFQPLIFVSHFWAEIIKRYCRLQAFLGLPDIKKSTNYKWLLRQGGNKMTTEKEKRLKHCIRSYVEACCLKRGLIKIRNEYEFYMDGSESFIYEMVEEIYTDCEKEIAGLKKPFYTGPLGLKAAVSIACNKRINTFWRGHYLNKIYNKINADEYIFTPQSNLNTSGEEDGVRMEPARPENVSNRFGEPMSGLNQSPDRIHEEKELLLAFREAHENLKTIGENGKLYYKTILFYLEEYDENMPKKDEITALAKYLGVGRKRSRTIKWWARFHLMTQLSHQVDFEGCRKSIKKKRVLAERFRKISEVALLEAYDKRTSRFLDPYLDEKKPRDIRILRVIDGGKGGKSDDGKPKNVAQKPPKVTTIIDEVA